MKALDLYCGFGGWSDGLAAAGFKVNGVEIEPEIAGLYKHEVLVADVTTLNPLDYLGYDVIVGSPPCRNFSKVGRVVGHNWKIPPDPEGEGMRLINAFLDFVELAQPRYWVMENVPEAVPYVRKHRGIEPRTITRLGKNMRRAIWGNFPAFFISRDFSKKRMGRLKNRKKVNGKIKLVTIPFDQSEVYDGKYRKWESAKIPFPTAYAMACAVRDGLSINSKSLRTKP